MALSLPLSLGVVDARVIIRNVLLPLVALASVFLFPETWLVAAFLVLGQAHFAMAMLYQYRGGKVTRTYVLTALAVVVAAVAYFTLGGGFYPIFFAAVLMFGGHFAYDEFHLQKSERGAPQMVTLVLFILLFLLMNVYAFLDYNASFAFAAALIFPAYIVSRLFFSAHRPNRAEAYVWFVGILLMILTFGFEVAPVILLAIVSILHILNWYMDYGRRLADSGNKERLVSYWREVIGIILLMVALYVLYRVYSVDILTYYFGLVYYYVWAIAHFLVSIKRQGKKA